MEIFIKYHNQLWQKFWPALLKNCPALVKSWPALKKKSFISSSLLSLMMSSLATLLSLSSFNSGQACGQARKNIFSFSQLRFGQKKNLRDLKEKLHPHPLKKWVSLQKRATLKLMMPIFTKKGLQKKFMSKAGWLMISDSSMSEYCCFIYFECDAYPGIFLSF